MAIGSVLGVFIGWPWLALLPAALFTRLYFRSRRGVVMLAALAWWAYFPYELAMKLRILCSGECNIRVDLLLIYPVLLLLAIAGLLGSMRPGTPARGAHEDGRQQMPPNDGAGNEWRRRGKELAMTSEQRMPRWVLWAFLLLGGFVVLLSLGVLPYVPRASKRALFETPDHWQITSLGLAFAFAGLSLLVVRRGRLLRVLVGAVFLASFLAPMGWFVYFSGVLSLPQQVLCSIPLLLGGAGALFGLVRTAQGKSSTITLADDPVQDAEVLLAYGRTAQAQAVLQRAMQRHPARAAELQRRLDEIRRNN